MTLRGCAWASGLGWCLAVWLFRAARTFLEGEVSGNRGTRLSWGWRRSGDPARQAKQHRAAPGALFVARREVGAGGRRGLGMFGGRQRESPTRERRGSSGQVLTCYHKGPPLRGCMCELWDGENMSSLRTRFLNVSQI